MSILLAQYDLMSPGQDYSKVRDYFIDNYGTRCKPLASTWLIRTDKSAAQVRDELGRVTDNNDKILIFEVTHADGASFGLDTDVREWMKTQLGFAPAPIPA